MRRFAVKAEQRIVGSRRFGRIDVDRGAAETADAQMRGQRRLIHHAAA